ncbi:MAG: hypothetical protein GWM98_27090, partial [Nitrospinaceae bacterium]|nr:hypothetical protein [Nitrospinaceae bacterium]NIR57450.1 hypothetical protein [Nitrospinaceae bacterium]NIS87917.1 hypothetical protein [Nitrospinaceae bacterium]NIT84785.1 hypothetical protein [Nitrospinaceae bacterium]NIU46960.1 hypothetical protein [Nitrospinaceae bacterium]
MRILLRLALFVYLFLVFASSLWAQNLDIFNTSKPFSLDRLPPGKRWVDLAHLTPEDIPDHLPGYLKSLRRAQGPVERNLLALAGGYLYL